MLVLLQTFRKPPQALVERRRVIPESRVSRSRHHLNLPVHYPGLVLIDDGLFDDRILSAMGDQYRLADPRE